jgi:hypothetical protein
MASPLSTLHMKTSDSCKIQVIQKNGFEAEGLELNEQAAAREMKDGFRVYTESVDKLGGRRHFVNLLT